jgi:hypothetical protein
VKSTSQRGGLSGAGTRYDMRWWYLQCYHVCRGWWIRTSVLDLWYSRFHHRILLWSIVQGTQWASLLPGRFLGVVCYQPHVLDCQSFLSLPSRTGLLGVELKRRGVEMSAAMRYLSQRNQQCQPEDRAYETGSNCGRRCCVNETALEFSQYQK